MVSGLHDIEEYHTSGEIYIGLSSKSIAPTWPVILPYGKQIPLLDFYNRNIFCKVATIEVDKLELLLIACDVIGFRKTDANYIKTAIEEKFGIKKDFIILAATHNHSYPRVSDQKIREYLKEKIIEAVNEALNTKFRAKIGFGKMKLPAWMNVNRARPDGAVDTTLYVIRIDEGDAIRGIIFNFPSHPNTHTTAWGGKVPGKIGPEWPEYVRKYIETYIDREQMFNLYPHTEFRDVFTMFLLGAAGDLQPSLTIYRYKGKIVDRKRAFVEMLGDYVIDLVNKVKTKAKVDLRYKWANIRIPIKPEFVERIKKALKEGKVPEPYRKEYEIYAKTGSCETIIQALILNNACICTAPGEVTADLGIEFQRRAGYEYPILVTVANDYLGYFVSELMGVENIRYEAQGSFLCAERGRLLINSLLTLVNPKAELLREVNPDRDMGNIEGVIEYEGEGELFVGIKRECNTPSYGEPPAAPFLGRRVKVSDNGYFKFDKVAPGIVYLYADVVLSKETRPKLLMWGEPIRVKAGETTKVHIKIPKDFCGKYIEELKITDVLIDGYSIICKLNIKGKVQKGDIIRGWLFRLKDVYSHHKTFIYHPLNEAIRESNNTYIFNNVLPDDYAIFFWVDVNRNNRMEFGVDIISPMKVLYKENFMSKT